LTAGISSEFLGQLIYQGHLVKVYVTGAKKACLFNLLCTGGLPSIESIVVPVFSIINVYIV